MPRVGHSLLHSLLPGLAAIQLAVGVRLPHHCHLPVHPPPYLRARLPRLPAHSPRACLPCSPTPLFCSA